MATTEMGQEFDKLQQEASLLGMELTRNRDTQIGNMNYHLLVPFGISEADANALRQSDILTKLHDWCKRLPLETSGEVWKVHLSFRNRMDFGQAIRLLKIGSRITRIGWNGVGMFLRLHDPAGEITEPVICIHSGRTTRPWVASQSDLLANDWAELSGC